jgi:hypothetical protein
LILGGPESASFQGRKGLAFAARTFGRLILRGFVIDNLVARDIFFDRLVLGEKKLRSAGAAKLQFLVDNRLAKGTFLESHERIPYRFFIVNRGVEAGWEAWIRTKIP